MIKIQPKTIMNPKIHGTDNVEFESDEEKYSWWWIRELMIEGFIEKAVYEPITFELFEGLKVPYLKEMKTMTKYIDESIMRGHVYTPDWRIDWDETAEGLFFHWLYSDERKTINRSLQLIIANQNSHNGRFYSYLEVKPDYDQNNMIRVAKDNIKWVFDKHGDYVHMVQPNSLFKKTFTPERYFTTNRTNKPRTMKFKPIKLAKFAQDEMFQPGIKF